MTETRTIHDPFLGKDVEISSNLVDRLRGRYASGPTMPNGEPEFGWREFPTPPIQHAAADEITRLRSDLERCTAYRMSETESANKLLDHGLKLIEERDEAIAALACARKALEEVCSVSSSGSDTVNFLVELQRVSKVCAAALTEIAH